jgi:hypothetical protein
VRPRFHGPHRVTGCHLAQHGEQLRTGQGVFGHRVRHPADDESRLFVGHELQHVAAILRQQREQAIHLRHQSTGRT